MKQHLLYTYYLSPTIAFDTHGFVNTLNTNYELELTEQRIMFKWREVRTSFDESIDKTAFVQTLSYCSIDRFDY